ncbi:MAG: hypothetical protein ACI92Z_002614 [Paracoccaceae bacterium]|jgi:hypothetical protein
MEHFHFWGAKIDIIDVALGWADEDVAQSVSGVTGSIVSRQGDRKTLTGRYVVACDGSHSKVRDAAGIRKNVSEHNRKMGLLVFRSTGLYAHLERFSGKQFYCVLNQEYRGYWMFFGGVDLRITWFFHALVPMNTTKDNFDFEALLRLAAAAEFDVEFDHMGSGICASLRPSNTATIGSLSPTTPPIRTRPMVGLASTPA